MTIAMTLVVHDEADIIDWHLKYHLERGIDFVIATDHRSSDGTSDVLRAYERAGDVKVTRRDGEAFFQSDWVTEMARHAADLGAEWVINSDADEFWWPRRGTFRDTLALVPAPFGVVRALWRHFVLRPDDERPFFERMVVRRRAVVDPADPYHAQVKVIHRAVSDVVVPEGNHDAHGRSLRLLREWFPFEVLHFPLRKKGQLRKKFVEAADSHRLAADSHPVRHLEAVANEIQTRSLDEVYGDFVVDDAQLADGIDQGALVEDTRLRDFFFHDNKRDLATVDDIDFAIDVDTFLARDARRVLLDRVAAAERRAGAVEASVLTQLLHRAREP